ncbi:MAG TPA: hypothetical protein VK903_02055 [Propionicimonas sp.]|nr:hypothetical protein [Propionicimonas sp.]
MRRAGVIGVLLLSLLTGCVSTGQAWTPGPIITESVTPPPVTPGTATPTPTVSTPAKPTVPDPGGALDVSSYESAHFASPTGRIWCALAVDWALCHFPRNMNMSKVPKPSKVCPGAGIDVTGVSVTADGADYFCSGGAESLPQTNGGYTGWWKPTGYPAVTYDGQKMATLPYGSKLVHGNLICLSEQSGITCGNTTTGVGFKIARAGVTFIT